MVKKFVSICLVILLALAVFPPIAFAAEDICYAENIYYIEDAYAEDSHTYALMPMAAPVLFGDVSHNAWFYEAVAYVSISNIMRGTTRDTFSPNAHLSRAMMVTILYRMAGEPRVTYRRVFRDVSPGQWYSDPVIWAFDSGIVTGTGADTFSPNVNITREQLAIMMRGYYIYQLQGRSTDVVRQSRQWGSFTDRNQVSRAAEEALIWANYHGLITGRTPTVIAPGGSATRAEAATIIMRFEQTFVEAAQWLPPQAPSTSRPQPTPQPTPRPTPRPSPQPTPSPQPPTQPRPPLNQPPPLTNIPALEREVLVLINRERANYGIRPLEWDYSLADVARNHSMDMARRGFFAHVCPSGRNSMGRVRDANIPFRFFAENLSMGQRTPEAVVTSLMNSPGHRANILNGNMTHIGVGIYAGSQPVHPSALPNFWTQKLIGN